MVPRCEEYRALPAKREVFREYAEKLCIIGVIDYQEPVPNTLAAQRSLNQSFRIRLAVVNTFEFERLADATVCVFKAGRVDCWNPKYRAIMAIAYAEGCLKRELCFPNSAEALDSCPLAVVLLGDWGNPLKELFENRLTTDKVVVATEWDCPV